MAAIECSELPLPPQCLRMVRVALLPQSENRPDRMNLSMLAQQVVSAELRRWEIPDPQSKLTLLKNQDQRERQTIDHVTREADEHRRLSQRMIEGRKAGDWLVYGNESQHPEKQRVKYPNKQRVE